MSSVIEVFVFVSGARGSRRVWPLWHMELMANGEWVSVVLVALSLHHSSTGRKVLKVTNHF